MVDRLIFGLSRRSISMWIIDCHSNSIASGRARPAMQIFLSLAVQPNMQIHCCERKDKKERTEKARVEFDSRLKSTIFELYDHSEFIFSLLQPRKAHSSAIAAQCLYLKIIQSYIDSLLYLQIHLYVFIKLAFLFARLCYRSPIYIYIYSQFSGFQFYIWNIITPVNQNFLQKQAQVNPRISFGTFWQVFLRDTNFQHILNTYIGRIFLAWLLISRIASFSLIDSFARLCNRRNFLSCISWHIATAV